jgi:hypothetical protein
MSANLFLDPDDPSFVNIRVHLWLNFLSKRFLNIKVETAINAATQSKRNDSTLLFAQPSYNALDLF